ncbi:MAG: ribonuclease P protein component [Acidobacteriota bacterium]
MPSLRPAERVRRRADFERAYAAAVKISGKFMTLFVGSNGGEQPRLGIAATRRIGTAVTRNRAKRLTRELFRHHKPVGGVDVIVVPRREFLDAPYPTLEREFTDLLRRTAGRSRTTNLGRPGGARGNTRV